MSAASSHNQASLERAYSGAASSINTTISNQSSHRSSGYFPPPPRDDRDPTLSNTMANTYQSHFAAEGAQLTSPPAPGKFTEEWDASQRGSSIIDGPPTARNMQRSNSFVSATGDDLVPSRGNTLKKKPSLRRGNSLKRSGSRRSMKAGSVRSLALNSASDPDVAHSVFHCPVPTSGNPTEALATRFQGKSPPSMPLCFPPCDSPVAQGFSG